MKIKSFRTKLFLTLVAVVLTMVAFLIISNNFIFEKFYLYSKQHSLIETYYTINYYYNNVEQYKNIQVELEKIAINNNFDIIILGDNNISVYTSNKNFQMSEFTEIEDVFTQNTNKTIQVKKSKDIQTGLSFILLSANLDNNYKLYLRMPLSPISENVKIFNEFLYIISGITIIIGGISIYIITKKFSEPIVELNGIVKRMSNLDFSKKYRISDGNDEINELGRNVNIVSEKLEKTIMQLKETNIELEKDIENKSRIDEMRKQFISDVSHELKTPIALIQGYAEGLSENVITNIEDRQTYINVILDEANKMDMLVKQLLELMKLEYGTRNFNNTNFDITELINEVVKKSKVMYEEKGINVKFKANSPIIVFADDFYIEQVVTNYFTNAIKHAIEIKGKKEIIITIEVKKDNVIVKVFNTGKNIDEENLDRIWNRFYKIDSSRNRENGGSGIGLSLVKAIMNNYNKNFGVRNNENGVEFYFELERSKEE